MNVKQKLVYMFIGCLFTIAGYMIASLGGITTHAQQDEQVIDKIVCRSLQVVDEEGKLGINIGAPKSSRSIDVYNPAGELSVNIYATKSGGYIGVYNKAEKSGVHIAATDKIGLIGYDLFNFGVNIIADENGGLIEVDNAAGENLVSISSIIRVLNAAGKKLVDIGSIEGRPNDGLINVYNHKGEWRSISKD